MKNVLFVDSCVREESRTRQLAERLLDKLGGNRQTLRLSEEKILPLDEASLLRRSELLSRGEYSADMLKYARQLAEADIVVIAAPFWDLSFPSQLKVYLEAVMALGVTFTYGSDGVPQGLCRGEKLYYVSTSGGRFMPEFGYEQVRKMFGSFLGIKDAECIYAENLDVIGADVQEILRQTEKRFGL